MYITAHRVRDSQGQIEVHSFLHRHDENDCPFPNDPVTVPQSAPGRLLKKKVVLPPGDNTILSYLDLIAPEGTWSDAWTDPLEQLAEHVGERQRPLVAHREHLTVIFGAIDELYTAGEYRVLLAAALRMLGQ
jgi:hypothetical protein